MGLLTGFIFQTVFAAGLPVFPGAKGFGSTTPAGRGGSVYRVTNLNDSGPGSLRAAVKSSGPRVVVFEVSGTIPLKKGLTIRSPFITIAGQTAPTPGITLRGHTLRVHSTHDVLIQHIRVRVGEDNSGDLDGILVTKSSYNVIIDHCSVSWGIDENFDFVYSAHHATLNNSIISHGLQYSQHSKGKHSRGVMGSRAHHTTFLNNIMAHNHTRNVDYGKSTDVEPTSSVMVNNVVYNWGMRGSYVKASTSGKGNKHICIVGNVYKPGSNSVLGGAIIIDDYPGNKVYLKDNMRNGVISADPWDIVTGTWTASMRVDSPPLIDGEPLWPSGFAAKPVTEVEAFVLLNAGARPADRDAIDKQVVNDVTNGTGRIIDHPSDVGGWPDPPGVILNHRTLSLPSSPNGDDDGDGYTNLEEWLHAFAAEVEGRSTILQ